MIRFLDCFRDSEEWDSLAPKDPHFSSAYYRAWGGGELAVYDAGQGKVIQPYRYQGDNWIGNAYQYGGPVGPFMSGMKFRHEFRKWKNQQGLSERCYLCPFVMTAIDANGLDRREVVICDLTDIKVRTTTRHCIQKAQENNAAIHIFHAEDTQHVGIFEDMYEKSMTIKGAKPHWFYKPGFFAGLLSQLGPQRSALVMTSVGNIVESGCVLIFDQNHCYYHWAATFGTRQDSGVNHYQVWRVMTWAQEQGKTMLHLGGGLTPARDSLFTFKKGFSQVTRTVFSYVTTPKDAS